MIKPWYIAEWNKVKTIHWKIESPTICEKGIYLLLPRLIHPLTAGFWHHMNCSVHQRTIHNHKLKCLQISKYPKPSQQNENLSRHPRGPGLFIVLWPLGLSCLLLRCMTLQSRLQLSRTIPIRSWDSIFCIQGFFLKLRSFLSFLNRRIDSLLTLVSILVFSITERRDLSNRNHDVHLKSFPNGIQTLK